MRLVYQEAKEKLNRIILTQTILDHLQESLRQSLKEAPKRMGLIRVKLQDINGPYEAGIDKECRMEAYLPFLGKKIRVVQLAQSVRGSIQLAAQRLSKKVNNHYQRWKKKTMKHPQQLFWSYASSLRV